MLFNLTNLIEFSKLTFQVKESLEWVLSASVWSPVAGLAWGLWWAVTGASSPSASLASKQKGAGRCHDHQRGQD